MTSTLRSFLLACLALPLAAHGAVYKCTVDGRTALERIREHVDESLMLVTALNPHIGYENSAKIALKAHREGSTLREAALALGLVSAADFDRWIDAAAMTRPDA